MEPGQRQEYQTTSYRVVTGVLGAVLASLGVAIIFLPDLSLLLRGAAAATLIALGANGLLSAIHGRESWLSKIGPLP